MVEVDRDKPVYVISIVAEMVGTTQQQLRIYEKEKLIIPSRTKRNTRLYSQTDVQLLQRINRLHQDLGVNLAGIEVILNMRKKMLKMQQDFQGFVSEMQDRFDVDPAEAAPGEECTDLIPLPKKYSIVRMRPGDKPNPEK